MKQKQIQRRRSPEQHAAHRLMLSCRRLDTAITRNQLSADYARAATVKKMALLLEELGLNDLAAQVAAAASRFGQHISDEAQGT